MQFTQGDKDRFWSKVDIKGPDECWYWKAGKFSCGYGQFYTYLGSMNAHRVAWIMTNGPILSIKILALHKCDHKLCCNPGHLYLGNHGQNMTDTLARTDVRRGRTTRLREGELWLLKKLFDAGINRSKLAKMFKISRDNVYYLLNRSSS